MNENREKTSGSRYVRYGALLIEGALGIFFLALMLGHQTSPAMANSAGATPAATLLAVGGTVCITDSRTGDNIQFQNPGGTYTFTHCSTGFTLSGTGVITTQSGVIRLTDRKPDRNVNAGFLTGQLTGTAAIYFIPSPGSATQVYTVNQAVPNQPCGCPSGG